MEKIDAVLKKATKTVEVIIEEPIIYLVLN